MGTPVRGTSWKAGISPQRTPSVSISAPSDSVRVDLWTGHPMQAGERQFASSGPPCHRAVSHNEASHQVVTACALLWLLATLHAHVHPNPLPTQRMPLAPSAPAFKVSRDGHFLFSCCWRLPPILRGRLSSSCFLSASFWHKNNTSVVVNVSVGQVAGSPYKPQDAPPPPGMICRSPEDKEHPKVHNQPRSLPNSPKEKEF